MSTPDLPPDDDRFGRDLGASLRHHVAADPHHPNLLSGSLAQAHRIRRRRVTTGIVAASLAVVLGLGAGALATFLPHDLSQRPPVAGSPSPSVSATAAPAPTAAPYAVSLTPKLPSGNPPDIAWMNNDLLHSPSGQTTPLAATDTYHTGVFGSPIQTAAGVFVPRVSTAGAPGYSLGGTKPVPVAKGDVPMLTPFPYNGGVVWPRQDSGTGYDYIDAQGSQHHWPAFAGGWQATAGTTRYLWGIKNGEVGRFDPDTLTDSQVLPGYTDVLGGDPISNIVALGDDQGCTSLLDAQSLTVLVKTCTAPTVAAISQDGRYYAGASSNGDTISVIDLTTGRTVATISGVAQRQDRNAVFDSQDRLVLIAGNASRTALVTVDFLHRTTTSATDWIALDKAGFAVVVPNTEQGATSPQSQQSSTPPTTSTSPSTPTSPTPATSSSTPACTASDTSVTVQPQPGGGAAGSYAYDVTVTNSGSAPCTLHGFPGVSMVTGDSGAQLGAAADRQGQAGPAVTVAPKARASATLIVSQADNYGDACSSQQARGFRVYLPGERSAQFAPAQVTGCANASIHLLTIQAFGS